MNMMTTKAAPIMSERRVAVIGALIVMIGPVSLAAYTPAMPEIVRSFGTTEAAVKLSLTLYFAGFALAQLFCGPLSDGFGRRPVTIAFMGIYVAASVLALFSPTVEVLIAARFLQGVGAAVGVAISRAIVRDLFVHEQSARIMNMIGIILAIAPALSPTLGGLTMEFFGWHAIFVLMVLAGLGIMLVAIFSLRETVTRDLSRIRPKAIARSYLTLISSGYFMLSSIIMATTVGAIYTLATVLPFVLIERVGLTASQFGFAMLLQSGTYFVSSLVVRFILPRVGVARLVPIGMTFVGIGALTLAIALRVLEPGLLSVMLPIACYAFGIGFIMPVMTTASLAPFPHIAGSAAALSAFMQMSGGMIGSLTVALIGKPVTAVATVIPLMGLIAVSAWLVFRRLPEPGSETRPPVPPAL